MQFRCVGAELDDSGDNHVDGKHGTLEYIECDGYTIAHDLSKPHEKDLEGITFEIHASDSDEVTADDVKAPGAESYLEKFPYVYEAIAEEINNRGWLGEDFTCPDCPIEPFVEIAE